MIFDVMLVPQEEYDRARRDPRYIPCEQVVGKFFAHSRERADVLLVAYKRIGKYPTGSWLKKES